jgi:hypothetical protein
MIVQSKLINDEVYVDILNYEGVYKVNKKGQVFSVRSNKVLRQYKRPDGYTQVTLTVNYKYKHWLVHRLVAETFIDNPTNKKEVNHKDFNRANNNANNLEWVTPKENTQYSVPNLVKRKQGKRGVHKVDRRYIATIRLKGKQVYLGAFENIEDAYEAYYEAFQAEHKRKPW